MNDLELAEKRANVGNGIECSAVYTELNDAFDLVRETHEGELDGCTNGMCAVTWKPERQNAA
ncbi:MAG TPA: hypothetical protein V6C76_17830 [Drouetiella sp.]